MRICNRCYFNISNFLYKLLLALVCGFLFACSGENNQKQNLSTENEVQNSDAAININTASAEELERLPHIGEKLAREIIEHREKFGKFRKPEHLLLIRRLSDKQFREMRHLIRVE